MPLTRKLQQLVAGLALIEDPQERLATVVDRARKNPPFPVTERTEANRVLGCVSVVWLVGEVRNGRCSFRSDADSPVVRGLLALLCEFFSGETPLEVATCDVEPLDALDLTRHLSPTRRNGLAAARGTIRAYAQNQPRNPPASEK